MTNPITKITPTSCRLEDRRAALFAAVGSRNEVEAWARAFVAAGDTASAKAEWDGYNACQEILYDASVDMFRSGQHFLAFTAQAVLTEEHSKAIARRAILNRRAA